MKKILTIMLCLVLYQISHSQVLIPILFGEELIPEHGFLPGRKFPIFPTVGTFDFNGTTLRVELFDDRGILKLDKVGCSNLNLENISEFAKPQTIFKLKQYIDSTFNRAGIAIDSTSRDKLEIRLEALDARLVGFGHIKVHGLCQIRMKYNNFERIYCTDIVDGDKHSPLGRNAIVTRKTATRYMVSASIRESLEKLLIDFRSINKSL